MNIVQQIIRGDGPSIRRRQEISAEIIRLQHRADTLCQYALAAARTYGETGRESCLGAQARFENAAAALKQRIYDLDQSI